MLITIKTLRSLIRETIDNTFTNKKRERDEALELLKQKHPDVIVDDVYFSLLYSTQSLLDNEKLKRMGVDKNELKHVLDTEPANKFWNVETTEDDLRIYRILEKQKLLSGEKIAKAGAVKVGDTLVHRKNQNVEYDPWPVGLFQVEKIKHRGGEVSIYVVDENGKKDQFDLETNETIIVRKT